MSSSEDSAGAGRKREPSRPGRRNLHELVELPDILALGEEVRQAAFGGDGKALVVLGPQVAGDEQDFVKLEKATARFAET